MPPVPYRPPQLRGRVFRARSVIAAGLLSQRQLQSKAWRRLFQGVYADASVPVTYIVRCAVAVVFVLPREAVLAGRSAVTIHGVGLDDPDDVEVLVPLATPTVPRIGVVFHQGTIADGEWGRVRGLAVTDPVRTCWDLARWLPAVEAVVWIDRMLGSGKVTRAELGSYLQLRISEMPHPRGLRRFARVLPLVDGGAASPQESRLRTRLVLAGLPRPQVQFVILDRDGQFVARVDLAWDEYQLAVEYDGLWHVGSAQRMHDDRKRLNAVVGLGWTVLHVTAARLRDDFDGVLREVRGAMGRRSRAV
jgi:hypothetical protein